MSTLLPLAIRERGHHFSFLTRDLGHYLRARDDARHPLLGAANILTVETNDPAAVSARLGALRPALPFDGVLSSCDYYLPLVAAVAAEFGLPGPERAAVAIACDKQRTREVCAAAGVPGPRFAVGVRWTQLSAAATEIGYPLVVKPVDLCAGMFVRMVRDAQELRDAVERITGFPVNARGQVRAQAILLEECLDGPEYSVETVTHGGRTGVVGVTDKTVVGAPSFIESGHMFPAALDPGAAAGIGAVAVAAVEAIGLDDTVAHTEIKLTREGPKLIEVNPRPAGNRITELVRRVTGIDLPAVHAELAAGGDPDLTPAATGVGSAAVAFAVPTATGTLTGITGDEGWPAHPGIVDYALPAPGAATRAARDNNGYLGHVLVTDPRPGAAGATARALIDGLRFDHVATESVR
nr:ATP-grasp domain-containing protein [Nocardia bovistercoris]